jgi:apolipoprotein N-acyltransferase
VLKVSEQSKKSDGWIQSCVLSGLLLGLSVPAFRFAPLGFLAWAWLVPLLFELKRTGKFLPFLARIFVAVTVGFSIITLWVVNASIIGFFASTAMGVFVWTIPLVWFYFVRKFWNWYVALVSLPFFWTAWEWLYHSTEFSFGAVRIGYTQAEMLWLIQFADITGVEGLTYWLILVNVALFVFIERQFACENKEINLRSVFNRSAAPLIVLFVLPLAYTAFVFLKPQPDAREISVLAVQPNVSPFVEYTPRQMTEIFGKQLALTDRALKTDAPDLILWHEVAVPYQLSENAAANNYLAKQIVRWNAPVLTGLVEVKDYAEDEQRPPLLAALNRSREFFNAAALFEPGKIKDNRLPVDLSQMYIKRRLMPFLERAPMVDTFPVVADLIIPIGVRPRLSPGAAAKTLSFQTKDGEQARVGVTICYENLYPEMSADAVREGGAQLLTAITNEGFFAGSQGQYQLAAFSRFRSIETRRALVRAAATGETWTTDRFGRTTAEAPMWSEQVLRARVALSDERTIYVRWGNFFPKTCAVLVLLLLFAAIWQAIRFGHAAHESSLILQFQFAELLQFQNPKNINPISYRKSLKNDSLRSLVRLRKSSNEKKSRQ